MLPYEEIDAIQLRLKSTMYMQRSVFEAVGWPESSTGVAIYRDKVFEYLRMLTVDYPHFNTIPSVEVLPESYRGVVEQYTPMELWGLMAEEYGRLQVQALHLSDIEHYKAYMDIPLPL